MEKPRLPTIELGPSWRLGLLLATAHAAAMLIVGMLPLPAWAMVVALLPLTASAVLAIRRHALRRGPRAVRALAFSDRERLRLRDAQDRWHEAQLQGSSTVGAGFAVLNLLTDRAGAFHVVILGDGIDAGDWRRLRVWLRWGPRNSAAADEA